MRLAVIFVLVVLVPSLCFAQKVDMGGSDKASSPIALLVRKLRSDDVRRIQIVQIPPRMLTRTRITPEMLERAFSYKLIVSDIRGGAYAASVTAAVASMSAKPTDEMGDLRWGVAFFDQNEQRIASFYFDRSGRRGAVDDLPVSFSGDMFKWLDKNFSDAFK